jgi:hypothetical protein
MGLFNRKKSTNDDVNNYYASERRQRIGVAWALGLATLALTVLLAFGLFYGGRWVYRTVFDDGQPTAGEQVNDPANDETNGSLDDVDITIDEDDIIGGDNQTDSDQDSEDILGSNTDEESSGVADDEDLPSTGASELPSTGPSGPEELR